MQQHRCFVRIFVILAICTMFYTIISLNFLYSEPSNTPVIPDHHNDEFFYEKGGVPALFECIHPKEGNFLKLIDSVAPLDAIFFHEISCRNSLTYREACSVESAARANSNRATYVLFSKSLTIAECTTGVLAELATLPNVAFSLMNLNEYGNTTPFKQFFLPRVIAMGNWNFEKTEEIFKLITLYKLGGTVIDLDVMVVRSLEELGDAWASRDGDSFVSSVVSCAPGLSGKYYGQQFYHTFKRQIARDYGSSMESSLIEALKEVCKTSDVSNMTRENCKGFNVYGSPFFSAGNQSWVDLKATNDSYVGYYLWKNHAATMPKDSLYASLAARYCPLIYSKFMVAGNESVIHLF